MKPTQLVVPFDLQQAVRECKKFCNNARASGQHNMARRLEGMCAAMELAWSAAQADWNAAGRKKHLKAKAQMRMNRIPIPNYRAVTDAPTNAPPVKYTRWTNPAMMWR